MRIIELETADYDRVVSLWKRTGLAFRPNGRDSQEAFARQLDSGVQTLLGALEDDRLVGVVLITHDSRKGWINRLAVDPAFQRQGIGSQLIGAAENHLQREGIDVIATLILEHNLTSQAVFEQAGYEIDRKVLYYSKRSSTDA